MGFQLLSDNKKADLKLDGSLETIQQKLYELRFRLSQSDVEIKVSLSRHLNLTKQLYPDLERHLSHVILKEPPSQIPFQFQEGESFSETLLRIIDEKQLEDSTVYRRANMQRQLFSKIRIHKDYHPRKRTVLALCIALELPIEETEDLLKRAGYALSPGYKEDVIVRYFIEREIFDLITINIALFENDLQPL